MSNDIEAPGENTPLVVAAGSNGNGAAPRPSPSTSSVDSSTVGGSITSIEDDIKDELSKPWPATFDRGVCHFLLDVIFLCIVYQQIADPLFYPHIFFYTGIQLLAGPVLDEKKVDFVSKSPSVRARYTRAQPVSVLLQYHIIHELHSS